MAINTSSGYIGLGSRLFLSKENNGWGVRPGNANDRGFEGFNIYAQAGSRPQKTTTPIEVSQLYPSMLRRKPIKNTVSVEGSYTFALPTSNFTPFLQLITGDDGSGTGVAMNNGKILVTGNTTDNRDGMIQIADISAPGAITAGTNITISDLGASGDYIDALSLIHI